MRLLTLTLLAVALAGCSQARMSPQAALAQAGHTPTVRAAMDGSPGLAGPQEILALYLPVGEFAVKAGVIWSGQTMTLPNPLPAQAQTYSDACGQYAPQAVEPCGDAPTGRWVWTE